jgi:hypothetical protein
VQASVAQASINQEGEDHMNRNQENMIVMKKDDIIQTQKKISKMNEQSSHHQHRLSQSNNKYGSRTLVGRLTYRPCINNGKFGGRNQKEKHWLNRC